MFDASPMQTMTPEQERVDANVVLCLGEFAKVRKRIYKKRLREMCRAIHQASLWASSEQEMGIEMLLLNAKTLLENES